MIARVKNFLKEVRVELGKVSWPTRDELFGSTVVVIVSMVVLTVVIGICDFIFARAIEILIK